MTPKLLRSGKVRDIYGLGDRLLLVATDRISAFDRVLTTAIPNKGQVLTKLSAFWFGWLGVPHHLISTELGDIETPAGIDRAWLEGRSMIVRKCTVVPIECVVRGYLTGSGWKEYRAEGTVCDIPLDPGLVNGAQLTKPIFTPATKEDEGHDENISFERMVKIVGQTTAEELRRRSLDIYTRGAEYARTRGIIIADTKFEFGECNGELLLIDEVLTPDSSRFWPVEEWNPGGEQPSFDKQFVRDYLTKVGWDRNSPPPELPRHIVDKTHEKYIAAYRQLTGQQF